MTTLLKDGRDIVGLILASGEEYYRGVGSVKGIEVYEELGWGSYVPWFMVHGFSGEVLVRVNSAHVEEVQYE